MAVESSRTVCCRECIWMAKCISVVLADKVHRHAHNDVFLHFIMATLLTCISIVIMYCTVYVSDFPVASDLEEERPGAPSSLFIHTL